MECINSWREHLPDWNVYIWTDDCLEDIDSPYCNFWYKHKCYAHVSDYIRLHALNVYGGFYLDCDILLHSNLESLLDNVSVIPYENSLENRFGNFFIGMQPSLLNDVLIRFDTKYFAATLSAEELKSFCYDKDYFLSISKLLSPYDIITSHTEHGKIATHLNTETWKSPSKKIIFLVESEVPSEVMVLDSVTNCNIVCETELKEKYGNFEIYKLEYVFKYEILVAKQHQCSSRILDRLLPNHRRIVCSLNELTM